jgi:hypothetical protein
MFTLLRGQARLVHPEKHGLDPTEGMAPVRQSAWHSWDATEPGEYELCWRATHAAGNSQPTSQNWNLEGVENSAVQRVRVLVSRPTNTIQFPAGSQ